MQFNASLIAAFFVFNKPQTTNAPTPHLQFPASMLSIRQLASEWLMETESPMKKAELLVK